jgi:tetratricopeptide (TPR) repeat protein/transcriptional regulator with XRE-family HTH domain
VAEPSLSFAGLLRQLRAEARLTQEELAEAAGVSPRSISDLERGINRTAHKDTALLLAGALSLDGPVRQVFVAAARGKGPAAEVLSARQGMVPGAFAAAATRSLPRDIAAFTGRQAELAQLTETLASVAAGGGVVRIHAIDGMAGIGKTAFAVHAAHQLAATFPDGQFFLPLHAHTVGQRAVDPADALASLLLTAGVPAPQIPPGLEARAGRWRDFVAGRKILLLLDDAAGHEQVRPLLPGTAGSLVLVTSRRRLAALTDAAVISLDTLPPDEAAQLLARLAARPDLGSRPGPGEEITRLCGYLPLAIGMLASQLRHHPTWTAADLVTELAAARDRLALMHAENLSVAAAFDLSYADLSAGPQRLFRRLGLIPGPSFDAHAAAALDLTSPGRARYHLGELYDQHLITEPAPGRYQLHDLLREHARTLAAADNSADRDAAVDRLLDYYLHKALAAGQHFQSWLAHRSPLDPGPLAHAPERFTLEHSGAWLEAELPNLHAATDYAAASGRHRHAVQIPAAMSGFLIAHGHMGQSETLHQTALVAALRARDRAGQALALHELGLLAWLAANYPAAAASLARALTLFDGLGDRPGQADALCELGWVQVLTGDYPAATASLQQALALARNGGDRLVEAGVLNRLGQVHQLTGDYPAATASLQQAVALARNGGERLEADVLNSLGVVQQETGDYRAAAASQQHALELFRDLDDRPGQAYALNDLGMVHQLTGDYAAAAASHQQALELFRDHGNRLGQAEALNRLGELSSRTSATKQARERHTQALAIARDISVPFEEARALVGIGNSHLHDGRPGEAAEYLQQALAICQRIGVPAAQRIQETLHSHQLPPTQPPQPATPLSQHQRPPTAATPHQADKQAIQGRAPSPEHHRTG